MLRRPIAAVRATALIFTVILLPLHAYGQTAEKPASPRSILEKLLMVWPEDEALYFDLSLRTAPDVPETARVHVSMSRHTRVIEYILPHRYAGDLVFIDGVRLHFEENHGHEALRPTVYRDLKNRKLMWIASHLFGDYWEDFSFSEMQGMTGSKAQYLFQENDALAPVELLKVIADRKTLTPLSGQLFDHERDAVWKLGFQIRNTVRIDGTSRNILSNIDLKIGKDTYYLTVSDIETGALDDMLRGTVSAHE